MLNAGAAGVFQHVDKAQRVDADGLQDVYKRKVDMSTGSLGQGVSAAAGMALAAKMKNPDINVYTLLGDGEIEEMCIRDSCR